MRPLRLSIVLTLLGCFFVVVYATADEPKQKSQEKSAPKTDKKKQETKKAKEETESKHNLVPPAQVTVVGMKRVPLNKEAGWTYFPKFLQGAEIYSQVVERDRHLEFTVESDGSVIIAASWKSDGGDDVNWKETSQSFADLIEDGWLQDGYLTFNGSDHHDILRKEFKKGETVRFHTRAVSPPYVVLPTPKGLATIVEHTSTNVKHDIDRLKLGDRREFGAADRSVLLLNASYSRSTGYLVRRSILARELVRQAVLISARDELRLPTRDTTLREKFPQSKSAANLPMEVMATIVPGHQVHLTLFRRIDGKNDILWERVFDLPGEEHRYLEDLTAKLEQFSRTEFLTALQKAGFEGAPHEKNNTVEIPAEIAELLDEMSFVPQFFAVRQLHQLIREKGESPQLLSGLARGYANLGLLTEANYSAAHKAFKARALLYAERMAARTPEAPEAHWILAYVCTLGERYGFALEEIVRAEKLEAQNNASPPWGDILKHICAHNEQELEEIIDHPTHASLARLLRITGPAMGSSSLQLQEAARVLELVPDCYRAMATMYSQGPLGVKRQVSHLGSVVVATNLYGQLLSIPNLPKNVEEIAAKYGDLDADSEDMEELLSNEREDRVELIRALHQAGAVESDSGEMSWGVLGQLILEVTFLHAWQRVNFERNVLAVPAEETIDTFVAVTSDHPYHRFLEVLSGNRKRRREAQEALPSTAFFRETELRKRQLYDHFYYSKQRKIYNKAHGRGRAQYDECLGDLVARAESDSKSLKGKWARRLLTVAPQQPYAVAMAIRYDWKKVKDRKEDLETRYTQSAAVQGALGYRFTELKSYAAAERCLKRQIELNPDKASYTTLANLYKKQGDEEKWLATLDEFLESGRHLGLEPYSVRQRIARHFMKKKEWERAKPYAYAAAESYAAWGLICGRDCAEGLGDLETAEQYARAVAGRYEGQEMSWYMWCKRLDYGDLEAARELARGRMENLEEPTTVQWFDVFCTFYLLEGELNEILEPLEKSFTGAYNPYTGLHLAIIADELDKPKLRDRALKQILERGKKFRYYRRRRDEMLAIAKMFQDIHASKGAAKLDLDKVEEILKKAPSGEKTDVEYFVGRFLLKHGNSEDAEKYLLRAARSDNTKYNRTFAAAMLHEHGIDYREPDNK